MESGPPFFPPLLPATSRNLERTRSGEAKDSAAFFLPGE